MPTRDSPPHAALHPRRVFIQVLLLVFAIEAVIMLTMRLWSGRNGNPLIIAATDCALLTVMLSPLLWVVIVRPLRRVSEHRAWLLSRVHHAQEGERARLARDLHDDVGQQLTAVLVALRTIEDAGSLEQARDHARAVRQIASGAMESTRRLARGLSSHDLTDLGLVPMVERLCDEMLTPTGIRCTLTCNIPAGVRLAPAVESEVYRIIQEAVTNMQRHAQATSAAVRLSLNQDSLSVNLEDDGVGFDASGPAREPESGIGLKGMRERVRLLDGTMRIRSSPGVGTSITVVVPRVLHAHDTDPDHDR